MTRGELNDEGCRSLGKAIIGGYLQDFLEADEFEWTRLRASFLGNSPHVIYWFLLAERYDLFEAIRGLFAKCADWRDRKRFAPKDPPRFPSPLPPKRKIPIVPFGTPKAQALAILREAGADCYAIFRNGAFRGAAPSSTGIAHALSKREGMRKCTHSDVERNRIEGYEIIRIPRAKAEEDR